MSLVLGVQGQGGIRFHAVHIKPYPSMTMLVTIEDGRGQALPILPDRLRLFEDGLQITGFTVNSGGEVRYPLSTVMVMDCSGSMKGEPMNKARQGATAYVSAMRPKDRIGLVSFTDTPKLETGLVDEGTSVVRLIESLPCSGNTALYDALDMAMEQLKNEGEQQVKVLLALTDGQDNRSTISRDLLLERLQNEGIFFYLIALGKGTENASMDALAQAAKGRLYRVDSPRELAKTYLEIATLLQSRLEVRHQITHPADQKWHTIRLEVDTPIGLIMGERPYLADSEMRVNTNLLHQLQEKKTGSSRFLSRDMPGSVLVLSMVLAALILVLIVLLVKTRKRR